MTTEAKSVRNRWATAIAGGVIGSALTALALLTAPHFLGERLVRSALTANPDILVDAGTALRDRQYQPTLAAWRGRIETPFFSSWKGAARPDVTLTYFYDYACGYCRRSNPDIERLLSEDKGLRVVYRELPILGPDSLAAAKVSLAAAKAGKFAAFHDTMYQGAHPDPATIALAAGKVGVPAAAPLTADEARTSPSPARSARPTRRCSWSATG